MPNNSETFRVEGDNAELCHYLGRLERAIKLFVYAWNRRQTIAHAILTILPPSLTFYIRKVLHSPVPCWEVDKRM